MYRFKLNFQDLDTLDRIYEVEGSVGETHSLTIFNLEGGTPKQPSGSICWEVESMSAVQAVAAALTLEDIEFSRVKAE